MDVLEPIGIASADALKKGTRIFKKSSPNQKLTVYLGKRDFYDHQTNIDPIDGVALIDPEYVKDRKVFVYVLAAFRYGHEDLDILGLTFRKDLFLSTQQIYPPLKENQRSLTRLQERLIRKLGPNAYPFFFELTKTCPASVTLQPAPEDTDKPCGVDYELRAFIGNSTSDTPHKRSSVRLALRKLTCVPEVPGPQPSVEVTKEFMMSAGSLRVEASLDKERYYHGETITINVLIDNNSNKVVKKLRLSVIQMADIYLYSRATYKCPVAEVESEEGFPIAANQVGFCKVFYLTPILANNRDKRGLALNGQLKHEDTDLASSSVIADPNDIENLGVVVQYKVRVRLLMSFGSGDVIADLPFTLTHPKPPELLPSRPPSAVPPFESTDEQAVNVDLIQLNMEADSLGLTEDDLIFEDFARLRLEKQRLESFDA